MKTLLLLGASMFISQTFAQTTLFQDNFETGSSQWTLNTGSGTNNWVVNNAYLGFSGLIPDTPNQPGTFVNGPQSLYMHVTNQSVCGGLGVCNANFDTGSASNQNSEVATSINASTYTNITVSFWYLSAGQTGTSFGTMEYSNDGGATWVSTGTSYVNTSSWTQESVSLPAWNNSPAFKIRFKWQNGGGGLDPAFSIDHVLISGIASVSNSISTTNDASPASWCFNSTPTGTVNFTSSGTYNAGNVYTAQLSDATGSFAASTSIGTLSSTASGALSINTTIPAGIPVGTGYRVRVVSSSPATTGSDNTANLVINALPTVTMGALSDVCVYYSASSLSQGTPAGGVYSGTGVSGGMFTPSSAGLGAHTITYTYVDGNGCSNSANTVVNVNACASIDELNAADVVIVPNPVESLFQISGIDGESTVELVDFSGKVINSFQKGESTFDVSNLSEGVYIVRIKADSGVILTKLVKK